MTCVYSVALDGMDNSLNAAGFGAINDSALGILSVMYGEELSYFGQMAADPSLIPVLSPLYNDVQQSIAAMWDDIDTFGGGFFTQDADLDYEQFSQELQMVGSTERLDLSSSTGFAEVPGPPFLSDPCRQKNRRRDSRTYIRAETFQ